MMVRIWRLDWKFGGVTIYPAVMILVSLGVSLAAGWAIVALLSLVVPVQGWLGWLLSLAVALGVFQLARPLGDRWFVWHLTQDWVFNCQHGAGLRADYLARVDLFAARLVEVARADEADEVLVVGHSSGAVMAVEVMARALERDPALGRGSAQVALLTMGSCLPLVAFNPRATGCREGIARIVGAPSVLWAEYQAPQDWLNASGFNPVRDLKLGLEPAASFNPVIRSPRFREIVSRKTYESIVFKPFRMHFQFLMANDVAGEYDYIMMVAGPLSLAERLAQGETSGPRHLPAAPQAEFAKAL